MLESVATLWVSSATVPIKEENRDCSGGMTAEVTLASTRTHKHLHALFHTCAPPHTYKNKNNNSEKIIITVKYSKEIE